MFATYYPKYKILKSLTKEESTEGAALLSPPAPKNASSYLVIAKVLQRLYKEQLIEFDKEPNVNNVVSMRFSITAKGLEELRKRKEKMLFFWLPVVISILALLISVASVLLDITEFLLLLNGQ